MTYHVMQVAGAFIDLANRMDSRFTEGRLQKLLYIAQGWHLAITGKPLFESPIEAWNFGPLLPEVRESLKECGSHPITADYADSTLIDEESLASELILRVWDYHGESSGVELADITNSSKSPWRKVRALVGADADSHPMIPTEAIRKEFHVRGAEGAHPIAAAFTAGPPA